MTDDDVLQWFNKKAAAGKVLALEAKRALYETALTVMRDIVDSREFQDVKTGITDAVKKIEQFGRAVDALTKQGVYGYIQVMSKDEKAEVDRQIKLLTKLEEESTKLEAALNTAKSELEKNQGRITAAQKEAQKSIATLTEKIKLIPVESGLHAKQLEYAHITAKMKALQNTLEEVKNGASAATHAAKETVDALKKGTPQVTKIVVKASTEVFVKSKPLVFSVDVDWLGEKSNVEVTWTPKMHPEDLYKGIADAIIKRH